MLTHDARSQVLARTLPVFQYHPEQRASGHLSVGPQCHSLAFLSSPGLGRPHQHEKPGPSQSKLEKHAKETIPGFCFPAHIQSPTGQLSNLHCATPLDTARMWGAASHPKAQRLTLPRPAFSVWPSRPALIGSLPYRDLGCFLQAPILSHLCLCWSHRRL